MKKIVITGITGQMGYFLAKQLLDEGNIVIGLCRYCTNLSRKFADRQDVINHENFILEHFDLCDMSSIENIVKKYKPDVFFNCAAMSNVGESWDIPLTTIEVTGLGVLHCLEALRKNHPSCKFVQCSSSEMFGYIKGGKISETSQLLPRSPYGVAKVMGHNAVKVYRDSFDMQTFSVIMFNYESEKRGEDFFTRKITLGMRAILDGKIDDIQLGNLNFVRDWGFAGDYANAMIMIANSDKPDDYVISTGTFITGKDFIDKAFAHAGGIFAEDDAFKKYIISDTAEFTRPNDLTYLCGDSTKIRKTLGWKPKYNVDDLIQRMVDYDLGRVCEHLSR